MSDSRKLVAARLSALRMIVGSMGVAMVLVGAVMFTVLDTGTPLDMVHLALAAVLGVAGGFAGLGLAGSLVAPLPRTMEDADPIPVGLTRLYTATIIQCGLANGSALVAVALGFALPMSPYAVLIATILGALMVFFVTWPGQNRLRTVRRLLEREGTRCPLDELA